MKSILTLVVYGSLFLLSFGLIGYGTFSMIHGGIVGDDILPGLLIFSIGALLAMTTISMYALSSIVSSLKTLTEKIIPLAVRGSMMGAAPEENPMMNFLNKLRSEMEKADPEDGDGELPTSGTMTVIRVNEDGTHTPIERREFNSPEELQQLRNEILNKAFAKSDKKLEDMTIDELETERDKAVDAQDFELATAIRDLLENRKNTK